MKEAKLYKKLDEKKVQCQVCNHKCLINSGNRGTCGVRENKAGTLFLLVYGHPISVAVDPIEKKPLYRFMPKTLTLSFATVGCNFKCNWCQNCDISQGHKLKANNEILTKINRSPKSLVEEAKKENCPSISYTYTEPTIFFEYALDTMKLARKEGLKNVWVSNGYFSKEAFKQFGPYLDAINVDLKAFNSEVYQKYCGAQLDPVLDNLKRIKKTKRIHLEITSLIIPSINDRDKEIKEMTSFIAKELGKDTPWHISRFFPCYNMQNIPPTPVEALERAKKIGKKAGLKYVYVGNI